MHRRGGSTDGTCDTRAGTGRSTRGRRSAPSVTWAGVPLAQVAFLGACRTPGRRAWPPFSGGLCFFPKSRHLRGGLFDRAERGKQMQRVQRPRLQARCSALGFHGSWTRFGSHTGRAPETRAVTPFLSWSAQGEQAGWRAAHAHLSGLKGQWATSAREAWT